ncbi:hypothetical protein [Candidatus Mycoplasma haematohominis]|uniref:Uncharacterized protein n=1 Tax=Candidatus Mycoplasma haematohominis TaxID=1494318 RepID=A0A478FUE6_9MOLU|nr:hypothetical protein [Candidatus Mycoplasma haemohominis]GCE63670.1 hypothetical protein MHSWG343_06700 [Candidatus Mycoplasma haemohominis]
MDPLKVGVASGVVVAAVGGGLGLKFILDGRVVTLEGNSSYSGDENKTKVGGKFASLLASVDEGVNASFWSERVHSLASRHEELQIKTDGFFKDAKTEFEAYKKELKKEKAARDDLEAKAKNATEKVKEKCKARYGEDTPISNISDEDKPKWKEFWEFCSVEGKDKTDTMVSQPS